MSFEQLLEELPGLNFEQRQILIRRAVELDDTPLSAEDEALIDERMDAHRADPQSAILGDQIIARLQSRFSK